LAPILTLGDGNWRKRRSSEWRGARTCNLGVWRADFAKVNGFDERYEGWGHEDADLVARLIASGVQRKDGHFAVPVLHLWHRENDRSQEPANVRRLEQVLANAGRDNVAAKGLSQYLSSP
jgi:predicted glycosyltransferase involved in capsule biosynthesis